MFTIKDISTLKNTNVAINYVSNDNKENLAPFIRPKQRKRRNKK